MTSTELLILAAKFGLAWLVIKCFGVNVFLITFIVYEVVDFIIFLIRDSGKDEEW